MIESLSLRAFKAHRKLDLRLKPFTVIVGPNASGKTSILEGLHYLAQLAGKRPSELFQEPRTVARLHTIGATDDLEISISGAWRGTPCTATYEASAKPSSSEGVPDWAHRVRGTWGGATMDEEDAPFSKGPPELARRLRSAVLLHLDARKLASPSYSDDPIPRVEHDGEGLASVLAHLKLSDEEDFEKIVNSLREIVPSVERVRIERARISRERARAFRLDEQEKVFSDTETLWGHRIVFDMRGAAGVNADAVGEGTLLALGLLTVIQGPRRAELVLLDDVELALHPAAQEQLVGVLRKLQRDDPELQIVATSHSPFILNFMDPAEVRITALGPDGAGVCEELAHHPQFDRWKDLMSPGELWSTLGERWILAQVPHE